MYGMVYVPYNKNLIENGLKDYITASTTKYLLNVFKFQGVDSSFNLTRKMVENVMYWNEWFEDISKHLPLFN